MSVPADGGSLRQARFLDVRGALSSVDAAAEQLGVLEAGEMGIRRPCSFEEAWPRGRPTTRPHPLAD